MDHLTLQGKVILVTGSSRGLGRALALAFARQGARLVINSRLASVPDLAVVEDQLRALGTKVLSVTADISLRADVERLAGEALARFGRVDVLVNNASALGPTPSEARSHADAVASPGTDGDRVVPCDYRLYDSIYRTLRNCVGNNGCFQRDRHCRLGVTRRCRTWYSGGVGNNSGWIGSSHSGRRSFDQYERPA